MSLPVLSHFYKKISHRKQTARYYTR